MKRTFLLSSLLLIGTSIAPAFAMDDEAVMKQLKAMQQQIESLQGQVGGLKKELGQAKERASSAERMASEAKQAKAAPAAKAPERNQPSGSDVKVTLNPGPKFETADGNYSFQVNGFAQIDGGIFDDDRIDQPDGTTLRRARLSASGTLAKDFKYKLEDDFAGNASAITDAYLQYVGFKDTSIMVGQFKEPFGLETLTSDLFTSFIERALPFAFAPDRNIGAAIAFNGDSPLGKWTATAGGFGSGTGVASTDDEARDITGRITLAPFASGTEVLHLGVAASHRVPDNATDTVRIQSRPETRLTSAQAVDTGNITRVEDADLLGLEAAAVYGPFSLQGEYMVENINRSGVLPDATLDGYYVEASYYLTGESRNYSASQGRFDRVRPKWPLNPAEGNWGSWQLMARYSALDLTDRTIRGGEISDVTLGVKWWPNANVMLTGNYIMVDTDRNAVGRNDDPNIWLLRAQFDF